MRPPILILSIIILFSCNSKPDDSAGLLEPLDIDEDIRVKIKNPVIYWNNHFGKVKEIEIDNYSIHPSLKTGIDTLFRVMDGGRRYFYNEQQQLIEERIVFDDKVLSLTKILYDEAGNPTRLDVERDSAKSIGWKEAQNWGDHKAWEYDEEWNLLRKEENDEFINYYNYDSMGRISAEHVRYPKYTARFDHAYKYYGNSTRVREERYESVDQVVFFKYAYDSAGNMITKVSLPVKKNWYDSVTYRYDRYSNLICQHMFRESYTVTCEYEYDSLHNWTKKTEYYNNRMVNVFFRRLKYY